MHLRTAALASFLAATGTAQTTGVFLTNDYQVNGLGSGSTSCTPMCFPGGGVTLNLSVFAAPGSFAIVVFNFCPCTACSMPAPANTCLPAIPATACGGSNQSLDMNLTAACGIAFSAFLVPNSAGFLSLPLTIPSFTGPPCTNITISTQAAVINPCGLGIPGLFPGPFVMTQGYSLSF
jgi:hypothetical protein